MTDVPIAGWYPDPRNTAAQWRWWDGRDWTPDTAPRASALPVRPQDWGWDTPRVVEAPAVAAGKPAKAARAEKAPRPAKADKTTQWTSANTPWIWVLAFSLYVYGIVAGGVQAAAGILLSGQADLLPIVSAAGLLVGFIPLIVFADLDGKALKRAGLPAPSALWVILLTPLIYFVVRGRKLRKVGARSSGPELALFLVIVLQVVAAVLVSLTSAALIAQLAPSILA